MIDELLHAFRWYNLFISFVCFIWLTWKLNKNWHLYPDLETHAHGIVMWMMLFSYVWGTSENIYQDTEVGPRILVSAIAVTTFIWLLYRTRGRMFSYDEKSDDRLA